MRDSLDQVGMDRTVVVAAYTMFQSNSESARGERKWLRRQDWNYQILDEVRARSRFVLGVPHILDLLERGPVSHWVRQAGRSPRLGCAEWRDGGARGARGGRAT
jgi:hypothetical protein